MKWLLLFENYKEDYQKKIDKLKEVLIKIRQDAKLEIDDCMQYLIDDYEYVESSIDKSSSDENGLSVNYNLSFIDRGHNIDEFVEELETAEKRIKDLGFGVSVIVQFSNDQRHSYDSISIKQFEIKLKSRGLDCNFFLCVIVSTIRSSNYHWHW